MAALRIAIAVPPRAAPLRKHQLISGSGSYAKGADWIFHQHFALLQCKGAARCPGLGRLQIAYIAGTRKIWPPALTPR
jgi:hypothetical protein